MTALPPSCEKVRAAAAELGLDIDIVIMPDSTRTAEEAAAACGCDVAQIIKSLVFTGSESGKPCLLLVSGANRVHEKRAGRQIGEKLRRPDANFVRAATGFAIGGIPPFGHAGKLATYFDTDLLAHDLVWAAAGNPNAVFSIAPADLLAATGAVEITVT